MKTIKVQKRMGSFRVDTIGGGSLMAKLSEPNPKNMQAEAASMDDRYVSTVGGAVFLVACLLGFLMSFVSPPLAAKLTIPIGAAARLGNGVEIVGSLIAGAFTAYFVRKK